MGNFNTLIASVECSECGNVYEGKIQFRFGDTRQHIYKIGDVLLWGANDIGTPGLKHVKVYGILENDICPVCNNLNTFNEFDIDVKVDVIQYVEKLTDANEYPDNDGNFRIVDFT